MARLVYTPYLQTIVKVKLTGVELKSYLCEPLPQSFIVTDFEIQKPELCIYFYFGNKALVQYVFIHLYFSRDQLCVGGQHVLGIY
jgi:hypothetical protein